MFGTDGLPSTPSGGVKFTITQLSSLTLTWTFPAGSLQPSLGYRIVWGDASANLDFTSNADGSATVATRTYSTAATYTLELWGTVAQKPSGTTLRKTYTVKRAVSSTLPRKPKFTVGSVTTVSTPSSSSEAITYMAQHPGQKVCIAKMNWNAIFTSGLNNNWAAGVQTALDQVLSDSATNGYWLKFLIQNLPPTDFSRHTATCITINANGTVNVNYRTQPFEKTGGANAVLAVWNGHAQAFATWLGGSHQGVASCPWASPHTRADHVIQIMWSCTTQDQGTNEMALGYESPELLSTSVTNAKTSGVTAIGATTINLVGDPSLQDASTGSGSWADMTVGTTFWGCARVTWSGGEELLFITGRPTATTLAVAGTGTVGNGKTGRGWCGTPESAIPAGAQVRIVLQQTATNWAGGGGCSIFATKNTPLGTTPYTVTDGYGATPTSLVDYKDGIARQGLFPVALWNWWQIKLVRDQCAGTVNTLIRDSSGIVGPSTASNALSEQGYLDACSWAFGTCLVNLAALMKPLNVLSGLYLGTVYNSALNVWTTIYGYTTGISTVGSVNADLTGNLNLAQPGSYDTGPGDCVRDYVSLGPIAAQYQGYIGAGVTDLTRDWTTAIPSDAASQDTLVYRNCVSILQTKGSGAGSNALHDGVDFVTAMEQAFSRWPSRVMEYASSRDSVNVVMNTLNGTGTPPVPIGSGQSAYGVGPWPGSTSGLTVQQREYLTGLTSAGAASAATDCVNYNLTKRIAQYDNALAVSPTGEMVETQEEELAWLEGQETLTELSSNGGAF
jgi:hypothetical protein